MNSRCGPALSWLLVLFAVTVTQTGCQKEPEPAPTRDASPPAAQTRGEKTTSTASPAPAGSAPVVSSPERVVAIGDLHGDLTATRRALRLAGAIDEQDRWIGGKLVVVQTGDQTDRGNDEREIIDLFERLKEQAPKAGGEFHALQGNHEIMNVAGDFRYVTLRGFESFAPTTDSRIPKSVLLEFPEAARGRAAAFLPGGPYAKKLANNQVVALFARTIFVHGGLLSEHVRYGVDRLNSEVSAWMRGERPSLPAIMDGKESPVWTRRYSEDTPSRADCEALDRVLADMNARRMVVGHTVQKRGITSSCDGKVWRIDVGLAKHYGGNLVQALAIEGDKVDILKE